MLVNVFWTLLVAGGSAAAVFWALAIRFGYGVVTANGATPRAADWALILAWPFGARMRPGASAEAAASLNKMLVGLIAALLIVAGSTAVYSNLTSAPMARTTD